VFKVASLFIGIRSQQLDVEVVGGLQVWWNTSAASSRRHEGITTCTAPIKA